MTREPLASMEGLSDRPIPAQLQAAVGEYTGWTARQLASEQVQSTITVPLYHYTGWGGLCGILESQSVWFTDYRHLNDPSELTHGIAVAHEVFTEVARGADPRVGLFMQMVGDLFVARNFVGSLEFFTASFSAERDDLGQWRAYGDNGRGFAIGLAPKMFEVVDGAGLGPNEKSFVGPVLYEKKAIFARHKSSVEIAASTFLAACEAHAELLADRDVGLPFMRRMADELIAWPLIWNCITSKHVGYKDEREVRLVLMAQTANLSPYIKHRMRGSDSVSYVPHPFCIREPGAIYEIVVGPSAAADTGEKVRSMLRSHGLPPVLITRSEIPYRV